jgi:translation initiation factor 1
MTKQPHRTDSRLVYSTESGDLRKTPCASGAGPKQHAASVQGGVRVLLDTKSRRGKAMTRITGIQHNPQVLADLAKALKVLCGAGGTVEGRDILVQGDHRDRVIARLEQMGYRVRRG